MVRWHHCLNGHKFEQAPGGGEGGGSLAGCSPWGCVEQQHIRHIFSTKFLFPFSHILCSIENFHLCHKQTKKPNIRTNRCALKHESSYCYAVILYMLLAFIIS